MTTPAERRAKWMERSALERSGFRCGGFCRELWCTIDDKGRRLPLPMPLGVPLDAQAAEYSRMFGVAVPISRPM